MGHIALVGLGSNIDAYRNLIRGIRAIVEDGKVELIALSSLYRTSPVSPIPQNDFLNGVIEIRWKEGPLELLSLLETIEDRLGRERRIPLGPRTIDLDILLFDDGAFETPRLIVPHHALHERKFVLVPCLEIDGSLVHPISKIPLAQFLSTLGEEQRITLFKTITMDDILNKEGLEEEVSRQGKRRYDPNETSPE